MSQFGAAGLPADASLIQASWSFVEYFIAGSWPSLW
jgi:hypothetical protein